MPLQRFWILFLITAILAGWTHFTALEGNPGFHYDEAWSANFAQQIAHDENFLPVAAMSPQTSAWLHHYIAGGFQLFGRNLFVFRALHAVLSLLGILLMTAAFLQWRDRKGAIFFLLLAGLTPALILNHRFAIELTSLHALCFGILIFGMSLAQEESPPLRKRCGLSLIGVALFFGITAHVLFVAIAAALAAFLVLEKKLTLETQRTGALLGVLLLPFFTWIARSIPETGKAAALLVLDGAWIAWAITAPRVPNQLIQGVKKALRFSALPLGALLLFLLEGHWAILFQQGHIAHPALIGLWVLPILGIFWQARRHDDELSRGLRLGLLLLLVSLIAIAPKPTGRYYECAFLLFIALLARSLSLLPIRTGSAWAAALAILGAVIFIGNDRIPARLGMYQDRAFRAWIFHDDSRDFIPTQPLALFLSRKNCGTSSLQNMDSRLKEGLVFLLPRGSNSCPWQDLEVRRIRDGKAPAPGEQKLWSENGLELILPGGV